MPQRGGESLAWRSLDCGQGPAAFPGWPPLCQAAEMGACCTLAVLSLTQPPLIWVLLQSFALSVGQFGFDL